MNQLKMLFQLYQMKRQAKWSIAKMQKEQNKKLRKLLHYAWNYSGYYSRAFQEAGITAEQLDTLPLSAFPTIDKQTLLTQFASLITVPGVTQEKLREFDESEQVTNDCYQGKYHVVHSSGSTGKPGYFIYDESAWQTMLLGIIRGALWNMNMFQILKLLAGKPHIAYIAATDGRYGGVMAVGDGIEGVGAEQLQLDIKCPLSQWSSELTEFQPDILIGYPTAIKIVAEQMQQGTIALPGVKRIVTCGEPLSTGMRNYLEKIFPVNIMNIYGSSESLAFGVEANKKEGMLLFDDMNIIEVEDESVYITALYNYAQPLIRYKISDRLTLQAAERNDPYPYTRALGLMGRNEDILWFEDGNGNREFLHPLAVEGFCIEGLMDYQFRQLSKDAFEMKAEVSADAKKEEIHREMLQQMKKILHEKKLDYVQFYVNFVEQILPDKNTGKKPLICT
jgi:phenylacetate-CoA ligase